MIGIQARSKREAFDCKLKPFITGATAMVKLGTLSIAYHRNYASYMIHTLGAVIGPVVNSDLSDGTSSDTSESVPD